jgi:hypothetical protein
MEYKLTYSQYKEALKQNKLLGLRCKQCGAYTVPPKKVCAECTSEELDVVELSGKGKVQTFTVVRVPPEGFEAPYILALAELDEGPWLMGNIVGVDPNKVTMDLIGKRVKLGHKVLPGDKFSGGEMVAVTFSLQRT